MHPFPPADIDSAMPHYHYLSTGRAPAFIIALMAVAVRRANSHALHMIVQRNLPNSINP